jgi:hypothetical protein
MSKSGLALVEANSHVIRYGTDWVDGCDEGAEA